MSALQRLWATVRTYSKQVQVFLLPLILLPMAVVDNQPVNCGYVMLLMGTFWCTEAVPLAITSLLPIVLLPMMGILTTKHVCSKYIEQSTMMMSASLLLAVTVERVNLHRRIALNVLYYVGSKPTRLMLGFALTAWFLSMWMSNTAAIAVLLPILEAVLYKMEEMSDEKSTEHRLESQVEPSWQEKDAALTQINGPGVENKSDADVNFQSAAILVPRTAGYFTKEEVSYIGKALTLVVCYSSKVGGMATLTGTPPNIILKGQVEEWWNYRGQDSSPLSFATWMIFSFPMSFCFVVIIILWLQLFYFGIKTFFCCSKIHTSSDEITSLIKHELQGLGKASFAEIVTIILFVVLILLWFFCQPGFMPGWAMLFKPRFISDALPAVFIGFLLYIIPMNKPTWSMLYEREHVETLLTWDATQKKFPWLIIFMFGGAFAISEAAMVSGLSLWIGDQLMVFSALPLWAMLFFICLIVAFITEVASNSATTSLLMPIMAAMAENLGMNPLYLMLPVTLSTQFAFMLPASAPATVIALTTGRLKIMDMVKAGAPLNIFGTALVVFAAHTWGWHFFNLDVVPWPMPENNATTDLMITIP